MKIKQVILVVRSPAGAQRVVYDNKGKAVAGDEKAAKKLERKGGTLQIAIRGQGGETLSTTLDADGKCVAGNAVAVAEMLEKYARGKFADLIDIDDEDDDEDDEGDDEGDDDEGDDEEVITSPAKPASMAASDSASPSNTGDGNPSNDA